MLEVFVGVPDSLTDLMQQIPVPSFSRRARACWMVIRLTPNWAQNVASDGSLEPGSDSRSRRALRIALMVRYFGIGDFTPGL